MSAAYIGYRAKTNDPTKKIKTFFSITKKGDQERIKN
jgi:hypothetical protein